MENHEEKNDHSKNYSEDSFWEKLRKFASKAGIKVTYTALLLYYVLQKPTTPLWVKTTIIAALGYFISPLDAIPDLMLGVGYTDDLGALAMALTTATMYIDEEVKEKAKNKLKVWFEDYNEDELGDIDKKIV